MRMVRGWGLEITRLVSGKLRPLITLGKQNAVEENTLRAGL